MLKRTGRPANRSAVPHRPVARKPVAERAADEVNRGGFNRFYTGAHPKLRFGKGILAGMMLETDSAANAEDRPSMLLKAISVLSALLFVAIAGTMVLMSAQLLHVQEHMSRALLIALLLNMALILISALRHRSLRQQIVERASSEERAYQLAAVDPLTGFLNRRSIAEEGAALFVRAQRRGKAVAMLLLDLDHFKTVNDMHGHAAGDALLRAVAAEIAGAMPPMALTARLGGDEFACAFLFDPGYPDTVHRVAERLVSRLAQPLEAGGVHCHISCSIGIARSDFDCSGIETLMRSADIAMYAAKKKGRNRFAWFDQSMERELKARADMESGLRVAIPQGQIVPFFEPQIDLASGRLEGFEVLARWQHPTAGLIPPDRFIGVAEETGMIAALSLSIMHQAFAAARDWGSGLNLSVNISPAQLRDAWLAQKIIKVMTETGFPAHRLEVEITESALFDNLALAQSIVGSLKNQGVRVALDDFGTGYSSLAHLRALPFDRIKIDKSFVTSINDSADSAAIVNAIARLGESLNLPVTAEGIETPAIEARLRAIGCAKGQGWHYGKPMPAAAVRRLLAERGMLGVPAGAEPMPTSLHRVG